jgi:hypothetical protein
MCGGGVGSANDSSNDDEKGSGNSFSETLANIFTPGDGMSYVDGRLVDNRSAKDPSRATFYDYSSGRGDDGPGYTDIVVDGKKRKIRRDANDAYKQKYASALFGAATGGLPGLIGSLVTNKITQGATGQAALNAADTAGGMFRGIGIKSLFAEPEFANAEEEKAYREKQRARRDAMMASMMDNDNDAPAQTVTIPEETGLPAATVNMSQEAAQGAFQPIPNPDYDPNDPMSPRFLLNPTYAQLLAYKQSQGEAVPMAMGGMAQIGMESPSGPPMPGLNDNTYGTLMNSNPLQQYGGYLEQQYGDPNFDQKKDQFLQEIQQKEQQTFGGGAAPLQPFNFPGLTRRILPYLQGAVNRGGASPMQFPPAWMALGMAEGGEVTGGNEKTMIADAVSAVKGEMSQEESAIVLGQFLAAYGEDALRDLVDKVQSGELDDTVDRFANGEAGEVNGPGDGSGVDDKVPASLEGQQDVLLADGEFVLRKKTADALEKKYGGGFLDAINEAETDAPRTMREYMAKRA